MVVLPPNEASPLSYWGDIAPGNNHPVRSEGRDRDMPSMRRRAYTGFNTSVAGWSAWSAPSASPNRAVCNGDVCKDLTSHLTRAITGSDQMDGRSYALLGHDGGGRSLEDDVVGKFLFENSRSSCQFSVIVTSVDQGEQQSCHWRGWEIPPRGLRCRHGGSASG